MSSIRHCYGKLRRRRRDREDHCTLKPADDDEKIESFMEILLHKITQNELFQTCNFCLFVALALVSGEPPSSPVVCCCCYNDEKTFVSSINNNILLSTRQRDFDMKNNNNNNLISFVLAVCWKLCESTSTKSTDLGERKFMYVEQRQHGRAAWRALLTVDSFGF